MFKIVSPTCKKSTLRGGSGLIQRVPSMTHFFLPSCHVPSRMWAVALRFVQMEDTVFESRIQTVARSLQHCEAENSF